MDSGHSYFERWDSGEPLSTPMLDTAFDRAHGSNPSHEAVLDEARRKLREHSRRS